MCYKGSSIYHMRLKFFYPIHIIHPQRNPVPCTRYFNYVYIGLRTPLKVFFQQALGLGGYFSLKKGLVYILIEYWISPLDIQRPISLRSCFFCCYMNIIGGAYFLKVTQGRHNTSLGFLPVWIGLLLETFVDTVKHCILWDFEGWDLLLLVIIHHCFMEDVFTSGRYLGVMNFYLYSSPTRGDEFLQ